MLHRCVARVLGYWLTIWLLAVMSETGRAQSGQLRDFSITPKKFTAGASSYYTIKFTAPSGLNHRDKIVLYFPCDGGFDISTALYASNVLNLSGGFDVTQDPENCLVAIERDGHGSLPPNGTGSLILSVVGNPRRPGSYGLYMFTQAADGTRLDEGWTSVTITPDSLYRFFIAPIASPQRAGVPFPISITAQDAFGNTSTSFNNTVNLSSPNGVVLPAIVMLTNGRFTGNVVYQTPGNNKTIAVSDGSGHLGFSNGFNVGLGQLNYIQLRTAGNGQGQVFGNHAMTADDSVEIFAAGYDAANNYLSDVPVNWSQTGSLVLFPIPTAGASYKFSPRVGSPTTAGKIIGRPTASNVRGDTTGTIIVNPGKPFGKVQLVATPPALPANGVATAQVVSSPITDGDGNNVGANRPFTIDVTDRSLGSAPLTARTDNASVLRFPFTAGTTGGTATIFVASEEGSANGSVNISVNQLRILQIDAALLTVSQGQTNIPVTMTVQNIGIEAVSVDSAKLIFSRPADFAATAQFARPTTIPGNGATQTLTFAVRVNAAAQQGVATIDGQIFGKLTGGAPINDLAADAPETWRVQSRPVLSYVSTPAGLFPKQVIPGNLYQFQVPIQNAGTAALELKPDSTTFRFYDTKGDSFVAVLESGNGSRVPGNGVTTLTFQREVIPNNIQHNTYAPMVRLIGTHNGVRLDTLLALPNELAVGQTPPFQIINILSSQDLVTQGMNKRWTITLVVKNNNLTTPLNLRSMELSLVKLGLDGGTDSSYQILHPTAFKNNRSRRLEASSQDSLEFQIIKTGQSTGTLAVFARIFVNELTEPARSDGVQKTISVQTPARPQVTLRASQLAVTQNQTQRWQVFMQLKNAGESAAQVIFDETAPARSTRISLMDAPGYVVTPNTTNITLKGQDSAEIVFNVLQTGPDALRRFIDGQVYVREENSGDFYFNTSDAAGRAVIVVQTAAAVKIDATTLFGARNGIVSAGQKFQIHVRLEKTGEEPVDTVRVRLLQKNGSNSMIARDLITLPSPAQPAIFELTAGAAATDTFFARIEAAHSSNTRAYTVSVAKPAPHADEAAVTIQNPARLSILDVIPSEKAVRSNRTQPWYIAVAIKNTGEAPLVIESSQLVFKIGEVEQKEYTLTDSTQNTGIVLAGNTQQTLIYKVTRTGAAGGTVKLAVTVSGRDFNSNAPLVAEHQTATFTVETTALVKILNTSFPATVNRVADSDIALVNTAQIFPIEVTVENTGLEIVDTAYVSLATAGNSIILTPQAKAVKIGTLNGTSKALFYVQADRQPNRVAGETFTARLDSAVTEHGAQAGVSTARDSLAVIRIENPAQLFLSVTLPDDGDNTLTIGQKFEMRVRAVNYGHALTDRSGVLQIRPPNGYRLAEHEPLQKNFAAGDTIIWSLYAPLTESLHDTLAVSINMRPLDKNSGRRAAVEDTTAFVVVRTLMTAFKIDSTFVLEPAGAIDRSVSTEQLFTVAARITASANLSNMQATLTLPPNAGYRLGAEENATKVVLPSNAVWWQVQAPSLPHQNAVKLAIEAMGFDGQKSETRRDTLVMKSAQTRPFLELNPRIQETGAEQGLVSVNQSFTIVLNLRKGGEAPVKDTAEVAIDISQTQLKLVESPGKTLDKKFVLFKPNESSATVSWQVQAPAQPTPVGQQESIVFKLTKKPRDLNSDKEVQTAKDEVFYDLRIVDRGFVGAANLQIISPLGARDLVLSTEQEFVVSDSVYWKDAKEVRAELLLPPGFDPLTEPVKLLTNSGGSGYDKPFWRVRAPDQRLANAELKVVITAKDARNDTSALTTVAHALRVSVVLGAVPRLSAYISNPVNARDYKVSAGQPFEVTVDIHNDGDAQFSGAATVSVDLQGSGGYTLAGPDESLRKTSDRYKLIWKIRARPNFSDENNFIIFRLEAAPRDTNTNKPPLRALSQAVLTVRTEAKTLLVEPVGESGGPAVRGQKNLPMWRLKLTNPGGAGSSTLALRKLRFKLHDREQRAVSPSTALAGIRIVDDNRRHRVYGALTAVPTAGPLQVSFAEHVMLAPSQPDTILILGEVAEGATARNFRLVFDHGQDFDVADQDSGLAVMVENNNGHSGGDFYLKSNLTVLFGAAPAEAFFNYPNPFPPGNDRTQDQGTYFNYNLPTASNGRLQIFTLLGELVWETSFTAADPAGQAGNHSRDIFWNGHNDAGKRVLNGVYLAVLRLPQHGTFTTKVAVLKK